MSSIGTLESNLSRSDEELMNLNWASRNLNCGVFRLIGKINCREATSISRESIVVPSEREVDIAKRHRSDASHSLVSTNTLVEPDYSAI